MAKKCAVCDEHKVGWLSATIDSDSNSKICDSCLKKINLEPGKIHNELIIQHDGIKRIRTMISNGEIMDYKKRFLEIKEENKNKKESEKETYELLLNSFKSKNLAKYHGLYFDGEEKRILVPKTATQEYQLFNFDDLISFNPIIREGQINKHHGLSRAIVGGAVFGAGGAIVGAATGHKNFSSISKMAVDLNFKNGYTRTVSFINTPTKTDSLTFKAIDKDFSTYCALLERITDSRVNDSQKDASENEITTIDKLRELKQMLDENLITQEEFSAKKNKILDI